MVDIAKMTPMEAINFLNDLQEMAKSDKKWIKKFRDLGIKELFDCGFQISDFRLKGFVELKLDGL
jgi:hypothetical protein